ncbi:Lon protease family protein [Methylobacter sp.]|uniref:Lon protease family protein n=1 Tax=Methylobacter sp. TaxID=2051955 RepID=UPI0024897AA0|nr:ATP-binding protein [Methylobacter sp.]MDI1279217.1 ATP-binding protein [Methylobacter sp.]MDI1360014.1 ATP-binding protein [Methylobacter sp.]
MSNTLKLPLESLKLNVDLTGFEFPTAPKLPDTILGQSRAQSALEFGVAMSNPGYNIFVMGEPGLGRLSMITNHLDAQAKTLPAPPSYAYVDNFDNPREPVAVELPAEYGQTLSKDIEKLIDNLLATFPAAFESPTYQQKKSAIERHFNQYYNNAIDLVDKKAQSLEIALFREGETISFAPIRDNKALNEDQFTQLPLTEREVFHKHVEELEVYLSDVLLELPQWRRAMVEKIKQLDNDTIDLAIEPLFAELNDSYQNIDDVISFLAEIKKNLGNTIADYLMPSRTPEPQDNTVKRQLLTELYAPNILVDNKQESGAPVIYEPHPIYQNLFGRIEYVSDQGTLVTNYRRICAGSLHKANGGYLILNAEKLLNYPFVWEGLKRALQSGRIEIESPYSDLGINTITLKPEVIPLNVKVILVGSRDIYYLLEELDDEFNEMFKILADFDSYIPRTDESMQRFILLMIRQAADSGAKPLTRTAIECLIEHSCRLSENQHHFSARIKDSLEIIGEANLFCKRDNQPVCDRSHIEQALAAREHRNGRMPENILEEMLVGTILIDTDGEAVGKVNGLTVLEVGGSSFGAPVRITASVYPGSRGIVDVEREVELGQAIHSKGVMILTGYLGHTYAQQFPLAISGSIAIEQSYGYIDGDSASLGELCCLISALTRMPIKQTFAVTGSINQYGEVQAVGGVNEKIEGFFRLCQARGLNGQHAAIIPAANKRNLMLKQEVIDAVAKGLFVVYAVSSVDETLKLLTGESAGVLDGEGMYPEDSINFKAISRLKEISDMATDEDDKEEGV